MIVVSVKFVGPLLYIILAAKSFPNPSEFESDHLCSVADLHGSNGLVDARISEMTVSRKSFIASKMSWIGTDTASSI